MKSPADQFCRVLFSSNTLRDLGLNGFQFPLPIKAKKGLKAAKSFGLEQLLYWLQDYSASLTVAEEWLSLEPAMRGLVGAITPEAGIDTGILELPNCRIHFSTVDLKKEIVTIQRGLHLVAALQSAESGMLLTSVYRPLCVKSVRYLTGLSIIPAKDGTVCHRENNWEYACDSSAGMGNIYSSEEGEAYLSYWQYGIGISHDLTPVSGWIDQMELPPIPVNQAAVYILVAESMKAEPYDD